MSEDNWGQKPHSNKKFVYIILIIIVIIITTFTIVDVTNFGLTEEQILEKVITAKLTRSNENYKELVGITLFDGDTVTINHDFTFQSMYELEIILPIINKVAFTILPSDVEILVDYDELMVTVVWMPHTLDDSTGLTRDGLQNELIRDVFDREGN